MLKFIIRLLEFLFGGEREAQPYIKNVRNKKLINYWWSKVFYSPDHLKRMAGKYPLYPQ